MPGPTALYTATCTIASVAFDQRDGDLLVFATSNKLIFYDWVKDELVETIKTEETRFVAFTPQTNLLVVSTGAPALDLSEFSGLPPVELLERFLLFLNDLVYALNPGKLAQMEQYWKVLLANIRAVNEVEPTDKFRRVLSESLIAVHHRIEELQKSVLKRVFDATIPLEVDLQCVIKFLANFDSVDEVLVKDLFYIVDGFLQVADESSLFSWTPQSPAHYLRVWDCERDGRPLFDHTLKIVAACNVHHNCTIGLSSDKVAVFDRNLCGKMTSSLLRFTVFND